jgi:hypothetical protein
VRWRQSRLRLLGPSHGKPMYNYSNSNLAGEPRYNQELFSVGKLEQDMLLPKLGG